MSEGGQQNNRLHDLTQPSDATVVDSQVGGGSASIPPVIGPYKVKRPIGSDGMAGWRRHAGVGARAVSFFDSAFTSN